MNIGNQAHNGLAGKRASERPMSPFAPRQHVPSRIESRLLLAPFWRGSARLTRPRVKREVSPHGDSPFRTLPKVTDGNWLLRNTFNFATLATGKNRGDVLQNSSHFATPQRPKSQIHRMSGRFANCHVRSSEIYRRTYLRRRRQYDTHVHLSPSSARTPESRRFFAPPSG